MTLPAVAEDFCGLGIFCESDAGEYTSCAVDVQKRLTVFRYGFLSDFSRAETSEEDVLAMAKHHVNAVQFYDWSYRHDTLVAGFDDYTDMMGKPISTIPQIMIEKQRLMEKSSFIPNPFCFSAC